MIELPPPLSAAEERMYQAMVDVAREQTRPEAEKIRAARMKQELEILRTKRGIAPEAAALPAEA